MGRDREKTSKGNILLRKFNIIGLLIIVVPVLALAYIIYHSDIDLQDSHGFIMAMALLLALAGLAIVRYIFSIMQTILNLVSRADRDNDALSSAIEKDVSDLHRISALFSDLMDRFEKSTAELNQRIVELNAVQEMTEVARETLHVEELLKLVLNKAMQALGVKNGSVFLVDPSIPEEVRFVAAEPPTIPSSSNDGPRDHSLIKAVIAEGKPLLVQDIEKDPRTRKTNNPRYGSPSFLSMPIYSRKRVLAVLNLTNKEKGNLFSESDERILSIMLGEIGFALENAVLHSELAKHAEQIEERNRALESEIGERTKAEAELRQTNEALQEANRNLTQAYEWMRNNRDQMRKNYFKEEIGFLVDREGTILSMTERVLEVTRQSRAELLGRNITDILCSSSVEVFRQELRQAWLGIAHNIPVTLEPLNGNDTGELFEATLTRLTSENKREMLVILR